MLESSLFLFKVSCTACFGVETWKFDRIVRALAKIPDANVPPEPSPDFDVEFIAAQFTKYCKLIPCPGCGKTGNLKVWRMTPQ